MQIPYRKPGKYTFIKPDYRLTPDKLKEIKEYLKKLKEYSQPEAIKETKRTAEDGDFSENAGYQVAKGRLRAINRRIIELEDRIGQAIVISPTDNSFVQLGNKVTLKTTGLEKTFLILGSSETDPSQGVISDHSPIGKVLLDKKIGDEVLLKIEGKERVWKIVGIE